MIRGNEKVTLQKQCGTIIDDIKSKVVQPDMFFIDDPNLPIEEGDYFLRGLPNGLEEMYIILDRGYYNSFGSIKAHYQCKVKKVSCIELENPKQVIYNLYGSNNRLNNNLIDNSINLVELSADDVFEKIRKLIKESIENDSTKRVLRDIVSNMELTQGANEFNQHYIRFITNIANQINIFSPLIPALSQMIQ
ncbi:hypothetical protein [Peribacillus loiseleuriae]|uniref:hypothetical protein n=1 Tax=Peribacillus loiseleuriae TaxID=1679170 RepID=UPI000670A89B|nr:hypothetical protein [Peribacillus loiseleuriae]